MGTVTAIRIPSPADVPTMTAAELVERIRAEGGRVLRMRQPPSVFVLTGDEKLADWLYEHGATAWTTRGLGTNGSYSRARGGTREWDLWIHPVPVLGDQSIWEVAAR